MFFQYLVNPSEDSVSFCVPTSPGPPSFDDAGVIPEDKDTWENAGVEDGSDEELHPKSFSPSNVATS